MRGNFSTNFQLAGRELMTSDEVRMLDNKYSILFIRGEKPVIDEKYDLMKHPDIVLSRDGGAKSYLHGISREDAVNVEVVRLDDYPGMKLNDFPEIGEFLRDIEVYDNDTIDELIESQNEEGENKK